MGYAKGCDKGKSKNKDDSDDEGKGWNKGKSKYKDDIYHYDDYKGGKGDDYKGRGKGDSDDEYHFKGNDKGKGRG